MRQEPHEKVADVHDPFFVRPSSLAPRPLNPREYKRDFIIIEPLSLGDLLYDRAIRAYLSSGVLLVVQSMPLDGVGSSN